MWYLEAARQPRHAANWIKTELAQQHHPPRKLLFPKHCWGLRLYLKHVRPFSVAMWAFRNLCPLNSLHLSPSSGSEVHPFRISVLSIVYICVPARVVMSALFEFLRSQLFPFVSQAGVMMSALFGFLCSQLFTFVSHLG